MHNLLHLKGTFKHKKNKPPMGGFDLPEKECISIAKLKSLIQDLQDLLEFWSKDTLINCALVSVHYTRIIPKSRRIQVLLKDGNIPPKQSIRGAKFSTKSRQRTSCKHHVFTHYISLDGIKQSIQKLHQCIQILDNVFGGTYTCGERNKLNSNKLKELYGISKSEFISLLCDAYSVDYLNIETINTNILDTSIVTIYDTNQDTQTLLQKLGIRKSLTNIINKTTLHLTPDEVNTIIKKAPYLIAMQVKDFSNISPIDIRPSEMVNTIQIPKPTIEPTIGVIDTLFNNDVYFSEWVESINLLHPDIHTTNKDYEHGTAVCSIIVDGPAGNPDLEDGCGRFRVKHFGIATASGFSSFSILQQLESIIASNQDIKVWNLSLGSIKEIEESFISPEAAEIDRLQKKYDVIFVIAGTNDSEFTHKKRIGSPADSLNALVVNSVTKDNRPSSYSRVGPVLSFFTKPDVSYYGGDTKNTEIKDTITVCIDNLGSRHVNGTSFATPWVARKLAYLIHIMNMPKEVAKALLIHSSTNWASNHTNLFIIGHGIVPKHINDIITTPNDEILFYIYDNAIEYETWNYNLPVPINNNSHPFIAKATLVYTPECDRLQGVDYTCTELDLKFGRLKPDGDLSDIKENKQDIPGFKTLEDDARKMFRKWDNVKLVSDRSSRRNKNRKILSESALWGINIKSKERYTRENQAPLPFGIIITLKSIDKKDYYDTFQRMCIAQNWMVIPIDIENNLDIYHIGTEALELI